MNGLDVHEGCPHCDAAPPSRQLDMHVARAHADLPHCTARIEADSGESYRCAFRAGHEKGERGQWHASKRGGDTSLHYRWNDTAAGATPHQPPEPSDSLDKLKALGAVSHTIVATGNTTPCPDGDRDFPAPQEEDSRPQPPSDDEPNSVLPVTPDPRQPAYDTVYDYIRRLGDYLPPDPRHRNAVIWRAVHAALGATPVGRCVSSHCAEDDHMIFDEETTKP